MENLQSKQDVGQIKQSVTQSKPQSLSLSERRAFMKLTLLERRQILARQAEEMFNHYQSSPEWRELQAGDIIDY